VEEEEEFCQYCGRPQADSEAEMCGDCRSKDRERQEIYGEAPEQAAVRQAHREDIVSSTPRGMPNGRRGDYQ